MKKNSKNKKIIATGLVTGLVFGATAANALWSSEETEKHEITTPYATLNVNANNVTKDLINDDGSFSIVQAPTASLELIQRKDEGYYPQKYYHDYEINKRIGTRVNILTNDVIDTLVEDKKVAVPITVNEQTFGKIGLLPYSYNTLMVDNEYNKYYTDNENQKLINTEGSYQLFDFVKNSDNFKKTNIVVMHNNNPDDSNLIIGYPIEDKYPLLSKTSRTGLVGVDDVNECNTNNIDSLNRINETYDRNIDISYVGANSSKTDYYCFYAELPEKYGVDSVHENTVTVEGTSKNSGETVKDDDTYKTDVDAPSIDYSELGDAQKESDFGIYFELNLGKNYPFSISDDGYTNYLQNIYTNGE